MIPIKGAGEQWELLFIFIYLFFIYCWLQYDINLYTTKSSYV